MVFKNYSKHNLNVFVVVTPLPPYPTQKRMWALISTLTSSTIEGWEREREERERDFLHCMFHRAFYIATVNTSFNFQHFFRFNTFSWLILHLILRESNPLYSSAWNLCWTGLVYFDLFWFWSCVSKFSLILKNCG
jgi:hypothetical protein